MAGSKVLVTCLLLASQNYNVPPALMAGIYQAERGRVGQEVSNTNGSYDLGPMQINTLWVPVLAKKWGVSQSVAKKLVRDDACKNMEVAAWILRNHLSETKSLRQALTQYHSRTPKYAKKYYDRVMDKMKKNGLIKTER